MRSRPVCGVCGSAECEAKYLVFRECCGGNDEHPPEHCTDCDLVTCACACGHSHDDHVTPPHWDPEGCRLCPCERYEVAR